MRGTGELQIWQAPSWAEIEAAEATNAATTPSPPLP
jgi:hypothetical protein